MKKVIGAVGKIGPVDEYGNRVMEITWRAGKSVRAALTEIPHQPKDDA